jgi:hypothetical protein
VDIRVRIYDKYKETEFIENVIDAMVSFDADKEKLLAYESSITVPVEAQEVTKGETEDGPGEETQLF